MADTELGWLTITAAGILGLADSADVGAVPDALPVVGSVTLTPSITKPLRINSSGQILFVGTINAVFDVAGVLSYDGVSNVRIIAPQWSDLSNTAWRWTADIRPGSGQNWTPWSVSFTGSPGETVNLSSLIT